MSALITTRVLAEFPTEVRSLVVSKNVEHHGEPATRVVVTLFDGRYIEATFTNQPRAGFGGVEGGKPKDIGGLVIAKIRAVLEGRAEA
jgi:hypothetical protein